MNPQNTYPPQKPDGSDEYHPKTIFSEPQGPIPALPVPPTTAIYGATPVAIEAASAQSKSSNKKVFIIIGSISAVVVILLIIAVVVVSSASKSAKKTSTTKAQAAILQPATDIELEQINSSNTQDMSSLDDEKDYPATSLDSKTLGL